MPTPKKNVLPPFDWGKVTPGQRIAKIRKRGGLTQAKLGAQIGITQNVVSDYEVGRSHLSAEMIARFARIMEVSADEILGLTKKRQVQESLQLRFVK